LARRSACFASTLPAKMIWSTGRRISKLLGLDRDLCRREIRNHEPFTEVEASSIATLIKDNGYEFATPRPGQRFNGWEQQQCGKLKLSEADDEVPIPFAPVMAGVLLAGEVVKERYFPEHVLDSRYSNTLMGKFMLRKAICAPTRSSSLPNAWASPSRTWST
jgi:hypothetical protein